MHKKPSNNIFSIIIWTLLVFAILLSIGKFQSIRNLREDEEDTKTETKINDDLPEITELKQGTKQESNVRKPSAAGTFYSNNQIDITSKISKYINQADLLKGHSKLRFLVLPHAGLDLSGAVAAEGYKQVDFSQYKRIVLMGVSHTSSADMISVYNQGSWQTPLGTTNVDVEFANKLIDLNAKIVGDMSMHQKDHILEMQLIFIQHLAKNKPIVPISIGNVSDETLEILAYKLAYLMEETLIIVSADLSHYPNYEDAKNEDGLTIQAILTGSASTFIDTLKERKAEAPTNLETHTCGEKAISTMLKIAEITQVNDIQQIKYANSGDYSSDKDRVVGYGAIGGWRQDIQQIQLSDQDRKEAHSYAVKILSDYLTSGEVRLNVSKNPKLHIPRGVFSTIKNSGELRGCIGRFNPSEPLYITAQRMTLEAALNDSRFKPVQKAELENLTVELSFMTPKQKIDSIDEIEMGKHGVNIEIAQKSGTFLPEVAEDFNNDKSKFLESLCTQKVKAPANCYKDPKAILYTFTTKKVE